MSIEIRPARPGELVEMQRALNSGFLNDYRDGDEKVLEATVRLPRTRCAFDQGEIVGTLAAFDFELAVPGATLPTAGTTMITVRPTHRRQGLLRRLIQEHFQEVAQAGEALAALWASEASIYPRFGYGWAADAVTIRVDTDHAAFRRDVDTTRGRVRLVDADAAAKLLPEIYERCWRDRPGQFARSAAWWQHRRLSDLAREREGASRFRFAIYEQDGTPQGYLQYRLKSDWNRDSVPVGEVQTVELCAPDAASRAALWRFALDVDLTKRMIAWNQPADSELPWLLEDSRRAVRTPRDSLFVRVLDPARALAARRYAGAGRLVLQLRDDSWPAAAGRFLLETGPDGDAHCAATDAAADLEMDASDLGAIYLGGRSLRMLARAGRIAGSEQALARADAIFASDPLPWCPELF